MTCLFFSLTDVLGKENKEKDDKMNKFKQVALKAKKELENHKKQVCLCTRLLVDSMKIKLLYEIASLIFFRLVEG